MVVRPFQRAGLVARVGPFVLVAVAALAEVAVRMGQRSQVLVAAAVVVLLIAAIFGVPWERLPRWTDAIVPLAYLLVIALMRDAEGGRIATTGPLVLLPVVWFALYGTRIELVLSIAFGGLTFVAPVWVVGAPRYPATEYIKALNFTVVLALVGLAVYRLVTERRALAEDLERQASRDALTSLPNRRAWEEALAGAVERVAHVGARLAVAVIDLDGLKAINDSGGHAAGDRALREVTASWQASVPADAVLARLGGDEFALLLPGLDAPAAEPVVERMRAAGSHRCSVGVAGWLPGQSPADLMHAADAALYAAKHGGRDQLRFAATAD